MGADGNGGTSTLDVDVGGSVIAGSYSIKVVATNGGQTTVDVGGDVKAGTYINVKASTYPLVGIAEHGNATTTTMNVDGDMEAGTYIKVEGARYGTTTLDVKGRVTADAIEVAGAASLTTGTLNANTDTVLSLTGSMHADTVELGAGSMLIVDLSGGGDFDFDTFEVLGAGAQIVGDLGAVSSTNTFTLDQILFEDSSVNLARTTGMLDVQAGTGSTGSVDFTNTTITFDGLLPNLQVGDQIALLSYSGTLSGFDSVNKEVVYNTCIFHLTDEAGTIIATSIGCN